MSGNIKHLNLQTSNYYINYIQYNPKRKLNNKKFIQKINSNLINKNSIEKVPKHEIKALKTLSPIKKEKEEKKIKKKKKNIYQQIQKLVILGILIIIQYIILIIK